MDIYLSHMGFSLLYLEIGGKTVSIDMEVIDFALDYNLLLGRTWFYAMKAVASTIFRPLHVPHQGKIVTINLLNYCTLDLRPNANATMPLINEFTFSTQSIGAGMFKDPCLMGVFPLSAPDIPIVAPINMISSIGSYDHRIVPSRIASSLPLSQDHIPLPSSSPSEHLVTNNHKIWRTKKKGGRYRKRKPTTKALTSGCHAGHQPPSTPTNHAGGKALTSSHHDGKKLANGYHDRT